MTRPSPLVLDGNEVKLRLQAERSATRSPVHVDWLRFTCQLRNAPFPDIDDLFPPPERSFFDIESIYALETAEKRRHQLFQALRELPNEDFTAAAQAKDLAVDVAARLGPDFSVYPEVRKGQDFYRYRWSIVRNDHEVGWVGYLSSSDSPRQKAQSSTLHCNLFGMACTFADHHWTDRVADLIDSTNATITRCDLALDFFEGISGGMERIKSDYQAGAMNNRGHKPKCNLVGDWCNGRERSFYIGSKEAGKQTNIYEKGHQLYGPKDDSPWQRIELRYGNKLRVLSSDILRRPADFFSGASSWHAQLLAEHGEIVELSPAPITVKPRLAVESIKAEIARNVRWLVNTAAPSVAIAFQHLGDEFLELVTAKALPGRLQKFSEDDLSRAYQNAFSHVTGSRSGGGSQPAYAH